MTTTPLVTIYVRHSKSCKYGGDEFAKRCNCRKWLRWTQDGKRHRVMGNTRSWAEAEQAKRDKEDQLTGRPTFVSQNDTKTVSSAVIEFIEEKRVSKLSVDVLAKYERELERLTEFCERQGVYVVQAITRKLATGYASTWNAQYPSTQTQAMVRTRCRGFLKFCFEQEWLSRIPPFPPIKVDEAPTLPLDDLEYARLLEAAKHLKAPPPPAHIRALVQLMRWTGLSIRDSLTLSTRKIKADGERYRVVTKRTKTGTDVSVILPPEISKEILGIAGTKYIFWDGKSDIVKSWTKYVMAPLFKAAKIERGGNMISHRLRDTFAVDLLSKGFSVEDLSKLLGHSSVKVTERHYAPWVKARQDRLDILVEATWGVTAEP